MAPLIPRKPVDHRNPRVNNSLNSNEAEFVLNQPYTYTARIFTTARRGRHYLSLIKLPSKKILASKHHYYVRCATAVMNSAAATTASTSIVLTNLSAPANHQSSAAPNSSTTVIHNPSNVSHHTLTSWPTTNLTWTQKVKKWIWCKIWSFDRSTVIVGLILATIAVIPVYKAWELSQWTALKDYLEYCRQNLVSLGDRKKYACERALKKGLGPPPYVLLPNIKRGMGEGLLRRAIRITARSSAPPSNMESPLHSFLSLLHIPSALGIGSIWVFCVVGYLTLVRVTVNTTMMAKILIRKQKERWRERGIASSDPWRGTCFSYRSGGIPK